MRWSQLCSLTHPSLSLLSSSRLAHLPSVFPLSSHITESSHPSLHPIQTWLVISVWCLISQVQNSLSITQIYTLIKLNNKQRGSPEIQMLSQELAWQWYYACQRVNQEHIAEG